MAELIEADKGMTDLDPRRNAIRPDLADERLRGRVVAARYAKAAIWHCQVPFASLHRYPAGEAPVDTEVLLGEDVLVFAAGEGWSWVQLCGDGYVGYVVTEALSPSGASPTHRVASRSSYVLPLPDLKASKALPIPLGSRLNGTTQGTFLRLAGGGFIPRQHVVALNEFGDDFVHVAESLLGTAYRWGGKTCHGIDCSGLLQIAMQSAGLIAPRDSDMQEVEISAPLPSAQWAELRRGDLVFWRGHVGIMVDGGHLLHANGHHMAVALEPLGDAVSRAKAKGSEITSIRRPPMLAAAA